VNVSKSQIEDLEKWLNSRLGSLISHSEQVREVLRAGGGAEAIIKSATEVVTGADHAEPGLSPQQTAVWKALLPILAEHGLMTVKGGGPMRDEDKPLNKVEAAEFLGFSVRKLERCMKKGQIEYEKFGAGKTSTVRFRRSELEKYREKRKVRARGSRP
jgi:excisionase family DNA binding protein